MQVCNQQLIVYQITKPFRAKTDIISLLEQC